MGDFNTSCFGFTLTFDTLMLAMKPCTNHKGKVSICTQYLKKLFDRSVSAMGRSPTDGQPTTATPVPTVAEPQLQTHHHRLSGGGRGMRTIKKAEEGVRRLQNSGAVRRGRPRTDKRPRRAAGAAAPAAPRALLETAGDHPHGLGVHQHDPGAVGLAPVARRREHGDDLPALAQVEAAGGLLVGPHQQREAVVLQEGIHGRLSVGHGAAADVVPPEPFVVQAALGLGRVGPQQVLEDFGVAAERGVLQRSDLAGAVPEASPGLLVRQEGHAVVGPRGGHPGDAPVGAEDLAVQHRRQGQVIEHAADHPPHAVPPLVPKELLAGALEAVDGVDFLQLVIASQEVHMLREQHFQRQDVQDHLHGRHPPVHKVPQEEELFGLEISHLHGELRLLPLESGQIRSGLGRAPLDVQNARDLVVPVVSKDQDVGCELMLTFAPGVTGR
mmetsp:Transcript_40195/g.65273  ORF Transcript_40195/g.65273 Transcript_40195/m.65273 type:complete len:441 (+) Transcript_40195:264-1586(+)